MELARSNLVAASAPTYFWDFAVLHAVDILNRTSTPPGGDISSYEMVTGDKPSIMGIMPFGCKAFAVKPKATLSKTRMEPRAWVGVNLGRNASSPGAFNVFVPGLRIVVTSDVYFDETSFPWSTKLPSNISAAGVPPQAAFPSQPPGLPDGELPSSPHDVRTADHVIGAASRSRRVLLLFSGPFQRPDGISAF
eukprot:5576620-Pleurochrysis_carterae.AAC.1